MPALAVSGDIAHAALLDAACGGDDVAFDLLMRDQQDMVRRICAARLQDPADLDDAVQLTNVNCWRGLPAFVPGDFGHWVARVARNAANDVARQRTRRSARQASLPTDLAGTDDFAGDIALSDAVRRGLSSALKRDVEIVVDHHVDGVPVAELASRHGLTVGAMGVALHRARRRLEKLLEDVWALGPFVWLRDAVSWWRDVWTLAGPALHNGVAAMVQAVGVLLVLSAGGPTEPAAAPQAELPQTATATQGTTQPTTSPAAPAVPTPPVQPPSGHAGTAPPAPAGQAGAAGPGSGDSGGLSAPDPVVPPYDMPVPGTDAGVTNQPQEVPDYSYGVQVDPIEEPVAGKSSSDPTTAPVDAAACQAATATPVTYCQR